MNIIHLRACLCKWNSKAFAFLWLNNGRFFEIEGNNMTQFLKNIIAREKEIFSKEVTFEQGILNDLITKSDV